MSEHRGKGQRLADGSAGTAGGSCEKPLEREAREADSERGRGGTLTLGKSHGSHAATQKRFQSPDCHQTQRETLHGRKRIDQDDVITTNVHTPNHRASAQDAKAEELQGERHLQSENDTSVSPVT